jgi:translation initiation factor IF-1
VEEWTPGSRVLHGKARGVELNRAGVVSAELTDGKEVMGHLRGNKNMRKKKETRSRTHGGDRKTRSITNHDRRWIRGMCGRTEERMLASGVVWFEAPESAIH